MKLVAFCQAGEAFYATAGTVVHGVHKDNPELIKVGRQLQDWIKVNRTLLLIAVRQIVLRYLSVLSSFQL
jgi:hypothetical protein